MHAYVGNVLLEKVFKEEDSELDLIHVSLEEGEEVVPVHCISE